MRTCEDVCLRTTPEGAPPTYRRKTDFRMCNSSGRNSMNASGPPALGIIHDPELSVASNIDRACAFDDQRPNISNSRPRCVGLISSGSSIQCAAMGVGASPHTNFWWGGSFRSRSLSYFGRESHRSYLHAVSKATYF